MKSLPGSLIGRLIRADIGIMGRTWRTNRIVLLVLVPWAMSFASSGQAWAAPLAQADGRPYNVTRPQVTGVSVDGALLWVRHGRWGNRPSRYVFVFRSCRRDGTHCVRRAVRTRPRYRLRSADVGRRIQVVVVASNLYGARRRAARITAVIAPRAPTLVDGGRPVVSGEAIEGEQLVATSGRWRGTAPMQLRIQWQRCGMDGSGCRDIEGATSSMLLPENTHHGATLRVIVRATNAGGAATSASQVTAVVRPASVDSMLQELRLMNYYPAAGGWDLMWSEFNPAALDADFAAIRAMNANAVRLVVNAPAIGMPEADAAMVARIEEAISIASSNDLRVFLTLFDFWGDYSDVEGARAWATAVLGEYANDRRIAAIELQNEMPSDHAPAMQWAREVLPTVRDLADGIPLTISVSDARSTLAVSDLVAATASAPPDFLTYHLYSPGAPARAYAALADARAAAGGLPLYLGETGFPTSTLPTSVGGLAVETAAREAYQRHYLATIDEALRALGLPPLSPWTYSDFVPGAVPDVVLNGTGDEQLTFGLVRTDGTAKPAAELVALSWAGEAPDLSFNNGFEDAFDSGGVSLPTVWLPFAPCDATAIFARDETVSHTGAASARLSSTDSNACGAPSLQTSPVQHVEIGRTYTTSAWARGEAVTGLTRLGFACFDLDAAYLGSTFSDPLAPGDSGWTQLTVSAVVPAQAAFCQIHLQSADNSGSAWFDDVTFTEAGP